MKPFGTLIKLEREKRNLKLSDVFAALSIDAAIISKIERGERIATKKQVNEFVFFYQLDSKEAITAWLSDRIIKEYQHEEYALEAFKVAEEQVRYRVAAPKNNTDKLSDELQDLLEKADELKKKWTACKPLNKSQLDKMREYFRVNYTYDSNKIEGNTLTVQETHLVVNQGLTIGGKSMQEHLEAVNHYEAIDFIVDLVQKKELVNERILKAIHHLILKGIDRRNAGVYRSVPVTITGSSHKPPQPFLIARKMEEVFEFYEKAKYETHPIILAADMHEKIVTVHPFIDGNGRTSRLLMNLILLSSSFTIANIKGSNVSRLKYYNALEEVQTKNDSTIFYKLITQTLIDSLEAHIELAG